MVVPDPRYQFGPASDSGSGLEGPSRKRAGVQKAFDFLFMLVLIAACAAHVLLCRDLPGSVVRGCLVWGGCSRQRELFNGRLAFLKKKDEKTRPWHSSHRQVVL